MLVEKSDPRLKHLAPREFEWTEIIEDEYYFYLEVLPPIFHTRKGFMLSERYTDNVTRCVIKVGGKYFTAYVDFTGIGAMGVDEFYEKLIKENGDKKCYKNY